MEFKISVVMAAYNSGEYIAESIKSIINQTLNFKKHIQLIVVDDASYDNTLDVVNQFKEKYPDNISVISSKENHGAAHSRNLGLDEVKGEFVNFLDSDDYISENAFQKALDFFKKYDGVDIASIPIYFFGAKKGGHNLNFKFSRTQVINLLEKPDYIQLSGASSFFRFSKIKNHRFDEDLKVSEDPLFINQLLIKNPIIGFLDDCGYYYRKHDTSTSLIGSSTNYKSYYTSRIDNYFIRLIKDSLEELSYVPKFIQTVIMYDLFWLANVEDVSLILNQKENLILYAKLIQILDYIDVNIILNQQLGNNLLNVHLFLLKSYKTDYFKNKAIVCRDGVLPREDLKFITNALGVDKLLIDNIEFLNDSEIYISGVYTTFLSDGCEITVDCDGEEFKTKRLDQPQRDNYSLNFNYAFNYCFDVVVPVCDKISFKSGGEVLDIEYGETSRLSRVSKYYLSTDHLAIDRFNHIEIVKRTPLTTFKNEISVLKSMISERQQGWRTGILLRVLYFLLYNIYNRRRIWIFIDLPDRADDNAFKLFRYAVDNPPHNIDKVFTILKSEKNYNRLSDGSKVKKLLGKDSASCEFEKISKFGYVLPYKSLKHRLYSLFAEFIITSNPDNDIIYPFWGNFKHLSGLVRSKTVFLQHGVTLHNISSWLNDYNKHLALLACVSEKERDAFLSSEYGYGEDVVQVLGFPRFDYLTNIGDNKEIVIMPTWRRRYEFFSPEEFKHCDFYRQFNDLLNDDELIDFLTEKSYKLIFRPHPKFLKFMDAFDRHESVNFSAGEYSEVFNHASLLITDFSSVAFDFAYLKKPLIYYHVDRENFHFNIDESYFDYDEMGFGPVFDNLDDLKEKIKEFVLNDCEMDEKYQKRVDEFFKYQDKDNSKRVYEAILELNNYY
ncbi:MAG: glycosyltransferase [Methanobrevibacter thaueri]|nr:glycosyltransferase [Methanobrevibacter thaueri]